MNKKVRRTKSKNTFFLIISVVLLIAGAYLIIIIPEALKNKLPNVAVIYPELSVYTPSVECKGVVGYSSLDEIKLDIPVVLSECYVAQGERVDEGQVLAKIDKEKTIAVLSELYGNKGFESGEFYTILKTAGEQIIAQTSGVVYEIAGNGEVIMQGDSICGIGRDSMLTLTAMVSEKNISKVAVGQNVKITADAVDNSFSGNVMTVSSLASKIYNGSTEETVVEVEISIDGDTAMLKSGFSAKGKILTGLETEFLTLPYSAICQDEQGEFIYLVEKGRAKRKNITTGRELTGCTEVYGVTRNEMVINSPEGITEGMLIVSRQDGEE